MPAANNNNPTLVVGELPSQRVDCDSTTVKAAAAIFSEDEEHMLVSCAAVAAAVAVAAAAAAAGICGVVAADVHQQDVEVMLWEVDEDLDGYISWEEFLSLYQRGTNDVTGKTAALSCLDTSVAAPASCDTLLASSSFT
ncbi:hypothetical protein Emag_006698 [Eimeria magna]